MHRYEPYQGKVWRVIEGQYRPATRKIVDTNAEQARLEELLDASKPDVPAECVHLDYQFSTPFRYGVYPGQSRFRRPGPTPGVYYASERPLTAAIEAAWGRIAFFRRSPETPLPTNPTDHSAIQADVAAPVAIDLTRPDLDQPAWHEPYNYDATCALADEVRGDGAELIRYQSVRDPDVGCNAAVLTCRAFQEARPLALETWKIFLMRERVVLSNETARETREYVVSQTALAHG